MKLQSCCTAKMFWRWAACVEVAPDISWKWLSQGDTWRWTMCKSTLIAAGAPFLLIVGMQPKLTVLLLAPNLQNHTSHASLVCHFSTCRRPFGASLVSEYSRLMRFQSSSACFKEQFSTRPKNCPFCLSQGRTSASGRDWNMRWWMHTGWQSCRPHHSTSSFASRPLRPLRTWTFLWQAVRTFCAKVDACYWQMQWRERRTRGFWMRLRQGNANIMTVARRARCVALQHLCEVLVGLDGVGRVLRQAWCFSDWTLCAWRSV